MEKQFTSTVILGATSLLNQSLTHQAKEAAATVPSHYSPVGHKNSSRVVEITSTGLCKTLEVRRKAYPQSTVP